MARAKKKVKDVGDVISKAVSKKINSKADAKKTIASEKNIDLAVQSYLLARGGGLHCGVGWARPVPLYNLRYSVEQALASFARKSIQAG